MREPGCHSLRGRFNGESVCVCVGGAGGRWVCNARLKTLKMEEVAIKELREELSRR